MIYAMEPQALARRMSMLAKVEKIGASFRAEGQTARNVGYQVVDGVAHVPVQGALADSVSFMDELFGDAPAMTYTEMADAIMGAADDDSVKSIMLDVDSPGGEVNGLSKAVEAIQLARTVKPVHASVGSMAASAAYWIASQAENITAESELSQIGSIGVAAAVWNPDGLFQIASTAAPRKRPDASTDEGQAMIREELDAIHNIFARQIAEGRGVDVEKVNSDFGQGGIILAGEAKRRGMIDKVNKSAGVASSQAAGPKNNKGVKTMTIDQVKAEAPEIVTALRDEGIQAERKRVAALSHWKGHNADADKVVAEAVASGKTYEDVASQLVAAVAKGNTHQADGDNAPLVSSQTVAAVTPESTATLTDEEKKFCKSFGITEAAYLVQKQKDGK